VSGETFPDSVLVRVLVIKRHRAALPSCGCAFCTRIRRVKRTTNLHSLPQQPRLLPSSIKWHPLARHRRSSSQVLVSRNITLSTPACSGSIVVETRKVASCFSLDTEKNLTSATSSNAQIQSDDIRATTIQPSFSVDFQHIARTNAGYRSSACTWPVLLRLGYEEKRHTKCIRVFQHGISSRYIACSTWA